MTYEEYLQTPHWQKIKQQIYKKRNGECEKCRKRYTLQVHHKTYKNIGHEKLSELSLLCKGCHYRTHRRKQGLRFIKPSDIIAVIWLLFVRTYTIDQKIQRKTQLDYTMHLENIFPKKRGTLTHQECLFIMKNQKKKRIPVQ